MFKMQACSRVLNLVMLKHSFESQLSTYITVCMVRVNCFIVHRIEHPLDNLFHNSLLRVIDRRCL